MGTSMEEQKQCHPALPGRIAAAQKVNIIAVSNGLDFDTESSGVEA